MDRIYTEEQEKAMYATMQAQQAQVDCGCANQCFEKKETARERLQRRLRNSNEEHQKLNRVLDILERHPEFEEFLEVFRSGLV